MQKIDEYIEYMRDGTFNGFVQRNCHKPESAVTGIVGKVSQAHTMFFFLMIRIASMVIISHQQLTSTVLLGKE